MISKKLKHQVPKRSKHVWALVTLEGRGWKSPIQAVSNILPYGKQQSQNLQEQGSGRQGERWCGQTLMCDERSQEAGQRQSQKHRAAQQHVQERTEGRAGKSLHYCLGLHLARRGKGQRRRVRQRWTMKKHLPVLPKICTNDITEENTITEYHEKSCKNA